MSQPLPALFEFAENRKVDLESEMRAVRMQAALVRSLLDEMEELIPSPGGDELRRICTAQAVEEIAHLASRMLAIVASVPPPRATR